MLGCFSHVLEERWSLQFGLGKKEIDAYLFHRLFNHDVHLNQLTTSLHATFNAVTALVQLASRGAAKGLADFGRPPRVA